MTSRPGILWSEEAWSAACAEVMMRGFDISHSQYRRRQLRGCRCTLSPDMAFTFADDSYRAAWRWLCADKSRDADKRTSRPSTASTSHGRAQARAAQRQHDLRLEEANAHGRGCGVPGDRGGSLHGQGLVRRAAALHARMGAQTRCHCHGLRELPPRHGEEVVAVCHEWH